MGSPSSDREAVKRFGFAEFVRLAWHQVEPATLVWEPHMTLVCDHYQAWMDLEFLDMVQNVPPGSSKSTLGSVLFQPYVWTRDPGAKFMQVAYDEALSLDFASRSLNLVNGQWYQDRWPEIKVEGGNKPKVGLFKNSFGGLRFSTMIGGAATGRHANYLIFDDPIKPRDLDGGGDSAMRVLDSTWNTIQNTFSTRIADAATFRRCIIMQRLHESDPSGRMAKDPKVAHLCLPMLFEPHRKYVSPWGSDWRTEEGELLCPKRYPRSYMNQRQHGETSMSPRDFAAQHQQRPAPEDGALFLREFFTQQWDTLPAGLKFNMSVDASLKDKVDSDYCVIQVWGFLGASYYLVDQYRQRMTFSATVQAVQTMKAKWPKIGQILIEDKANGTAIVDALKDIVPGVLAVNPSGGKISRANAVEQVLRAMQCWFPKTRWFAEFVEEMASFPVGAHDDQVDCMTQALKFMIDKKGRGSKLSAAMENVRKGSSFLTNRRPTM